MKRMTLLAMVVVLGWGVPTLARAEVKIFACEPEWAALAREIGKGLVSAVSATSAVQDPHHIRARPSLIARIRDADLVFCSGGGLEVGWLPILLQHGASAKVQPGQVGHLMAADHVTVLGVPSMVDRSLGDIHPEGNPHVHLDARNIVPLAGELAERLAAIDPVNAIAYARHADIFIRGWDRSLADWKKRAMPLRDMPVIAHHQSWSYLFAWLGVKEVATLELKPGIPPTPGHLNDLLNLVRSQPVKAIIRAPYDPPDASVWLSAKAGIPIVIPPFTVPKDAPPGSLGRLFDETIARLIAVRSTANAGH